MNSLRILNLGAGVQSTVVALMAKTGEIEPVDYAIFADTQSEPVSVYKHLDWLISELPFPVLVRSRGNLFDDLVSGRGQMRASIPAFTGPEGKNTGILRRLCTGDYKIKVIEKTIRYEILGLKPRQKLPIDRPVTQIFGLSHDEPSRVAKVKRAEVTSRWKYEFPLYEMEMTRADCVSWLKEYGVPHEVSRSACTFCPYRSNEEWSSLKESDPKSFAQAVATDRAIRDANSKCNQGMREKMWLHRSCRPLDQIDFTKSSKDAPGQSLFGFSSECEGMCGV